MGAVFTAAFENVAVAAAQDFFELATGSANSAIIRRIKITANKTSSEFVRVTLNRVSGAPTSGSGGTTPTIRKLSATYGTATAVVEANNTTRISGGTKETIAAELWNLLTPLEWIPADNKAGIELAASEHFTVGLEAAPAASTNMSGWIEWEELG